MKSTALDRCEDNLGLLLVVTLNRSRLEVHSGFLRLGALEHFTALSSLAELLLITAQKQKRRFLALSLFQRREPSCPPEVLQLQQLAHKLDSLSMDNSAACAVKHVGQILERSKRSILV
jgi:hypothetical protein